MDKYLLFLDANVLFSAAYRIENGLLKLWRQTNIKLITSFYALEETKRNLKQREQLDRLEKLMKDMAIIYQVDLNLIPTSITLAQKDKPILAAAITAKANYLITGDIKDFGNYFNQEILGVKIIPPATFFALYL